MAESNLSALDLAWPLMGARRQARIDELLASFADRKVRPDLWRTNRRAA